MLVVTLAMAMVIASMPTAIFASNSFFSRGKIETLAGEKLNASSLDSVESDLQDLQQVGVTEDMVSEINAKSSGNEFTIDLGTTQDMITIDQKTSNSISYTISEGDIVNHCEYMSDGTFILDGYEVQVETVAKSVTHDSVVLSRAGYRSNKSLSPMSGHSASDYKTVLTSGSQNIALGKAIDKLAVMTLWGVLTTMAMPYTGLKNAAKAASTAKAIYDIIETAHPSSTAISCYYKTYIAGAMDYQYRTKVYSLKNNKGTYASRNTYEHFIVI